MKYLLMLIFPAMLFLSCNDDDESTPAPLGKASRTVLIYMAGENNLTASNGYRFLNLDIAEIIEGSKSLSDDQRLLVFVDSLNTNSRQAGKPFIMEVHGGTATKVHEFDSEFYSCDPSRFKEVLQWMYTNAPADSYGLSLWGHATGWIVSNDTIAQAEARTSTRAYGQDYGSDGGSQNKKWLNITQMARVLEGFPKMEFIFADCCNMMCVEVGYELLSVTNYLIGSPAEIPGFGAPYNQIIPYFYKNDSELYKGIIDTYYNYYYDDYQTDYELQGSSLPLSVIDTKYISNLATITHDILSRFIGGYPKYPNYPNLKGMGFYWYYDVPIMYDMRQFIKNNTTDADFQQWDKVYQQAVPHYRMSLEWMSIYDFLTLSFDSFDQDPALYGCVSMFIPLHKKTYYTGEFRYNYTFNNFKWNRVLDWERFGWTSDITY